MKSYEKFVKRVLIEHDDILKRIEDLGKEITKDYEGEDLVMVGILRGSMLFISDLCKQVDLPVILDNMSLSSYCNGKESTGVVKINKDLETNIKDKNVLIIEDIVDTGTTMDFLLKMLTARGAKSIKICSLLNKPSRRKIDVNVDYVGFEIDDIFVMGYGLDYMQYFRNYPHVAEFNEEIKGEFKWLEKE